MAEQRRKVLITGGTRGLGLVMATALQTRGHQVVVTTRDGRSTAAEAARVAVGEVLELDVTQPGQVAQALAQALQALGGELDICINNAGVGLFGPLVDLDAEAIGPLIATNLSGAILMSQAVLRHFARRRVGRVIHMGSVAGCRPLPGNAAYAASKHGLRGLSEAINEEWQSAAVSSTLINFGAVWTDIWEERAGFSPADMLDAAEVARQIVHLVETPFEVRIDEVTVLPSRGAL